jgi:hypothetical protein
MGCGACLAITEQQKNDMFMEGAKQMMKQALVQAYHKREKNSLEIDAPTEQMASIRKMAEALHKWSDEAKAKVDALGDKVEDKLDSMADSVGDAAEKIGGGMMGSLVGGLASGVSAVAGKATDIAASGTGFLVEKGLLATALALDAAIKAIDDPFKIVGNDIFDCKKSELITGYCEIIEDERVRINDAVQCVRGAAPYGPSEYAKCQPDKCVRTMQKQVTVEMQKKLHTIVQGEIDNHLVTKVWDKLIETYNAANAEIKKIEDKYAMLKGISGEPFKLDINEYIVNQVIIKFYVLMANEEARIRQNPIEFSPKTNIPTIFHLLFSGTPAYNEFTLEHFANMKRIPDFIKIKYDPPL